MKTFISPKIAQPVIVRWTDAQTIQTILSVDEIGLLKLQDCMNCGFLVMEDSEKVVLVDQLWEEDSAVKYVHVIPKKMIKSIKELKER
jgi:hypothetical protein